MADRMRLMVESGPKGKRAVAVAVDWPGLERGGKNEQAAIERLLAYVPRYAALAKLARLGAEFPSAPAVEVVERYPGTGSTDFWGISFAFSSIDQQAMPDDVLERQLKLLRVCWAFFDKVLERVPAELLRGPRGGGRERDHIARHIFANEQDWARKLGVITPDEALLTAEGMKAHRQAYCRAIRAYHSQGKMARNWPLPYLLRHTAYHTLDHAWEMEDRDPAGK